MQIVNKFFSVTNIGRVLIDNIIFDLIGRGASPTNCAPLLNIIFKRYLAAFVIYMFLTEHNLSFVLFLICSYLLPNLSFDVLIKCVTIKKRVYQYYYSFSFIYFVIYHSLVISYSL